MTVRGYGLYIDWSGHGTLTNILEDVSRYVQRVDLTSSWGRELSGGATLATTSGDLDFALNNHTRFLNPENTASPIYGKVADGREVHLKLAVGEQVYRLYDGTLDSFNIDPNAPAKTFTAHTLDSWGKPGAERLSTPLYSGIRTGDAVTLILDAIGWPVGLRDIDPGATVMPWWWEEGTDAATAVQRLVDSEGPPAIAYVEGGIFKFRDRHHRLFDTRSITSQGLFTHREPAGPYGGGDYKILKNTFGYDYGTEKVANAFSYGVQVRTAQVLQSVWTSDETITLLSGETQVIEAQGGEPFLGAVTPEENTDFIVVSGAATVSLSRTSGQTATLFITASADTVITGLQLRAFPIPVTRTVRVTAEDTASISQRGRATWQHDPVWANPYDARAIADRVIASYADARPTVSFTIAGVNPRYLTKIVSMQIGDRITVDNDPAGINRDWIVERLEHRITNLQIHRLTVWCVPTDATQPSNILTFDVAGKGFNDGAFGVTGIDNAGDVFRFDVAGQGFNDGVFAS